MRLEVQGLSMRGQRGPAAWETNVIDKDTGKKVGIAHFEISPPVRDISLFGGKYCGEFHTNEELEAFAKGVEAVLNHMLETEEASSSEANF